MFIVIFFVLKPDIEKAKSFDSEYQKSIMKLCGNIDYLDESEVDICKDYRHFKFEDKHFKIAEGQAIEKYDLIIKLMIFHFIAIFTCLYREIYGGNANTFAHIIRGLEVMCSAIYFFLILNTIFYVSNYQLINTYNRYTKLGSSFWTILDYNDLGNMNMIIKLNQRNVGEHNIADTVSRNT